MVFSGLALSAQQDPQFTMNFANKLFNNPAYAGTSQICATGIYRSQWTGFEGAPQDIVFSVHSPLKLKVFQNSSLINPGIGFTFVNDRIGPISTNIYKLSIANHFRFSSIGTISLGFGLGGVGVNIDPSEFVTPDGKSGTQGTNAINDPTINPADNTTGTGFDFDIGLYYQSADQRIWAGASVAHVTQAQMESGQWEDNPDQNTTYQIQSHAYFMGGYKIQGFLGTADWDLLPSAFVKTEFITTQVDLNVRALYQNRIWAGASWRFQDAAAIMGGYNWANAFGGNGTAKIGFSYDINTSKLFQHNVGSFEVFLNYCFGITPKPKISIHKNPLWL